MARLAMRKIENRRSLQVTFTKRRKGLVKKAYELSILCDIDIALIAYSPSGRPFLFSGKKRIEDVIERYINQLQDSENKERLSRITKSLKRENISNDDASSSTCDTTTSNSSDAKELRQEIGRMHHLLQASKEQLRMYEGAPAKKAPTVDMASCERDLLNVLTLVQQRKEYLLNNLLSSYHITEIPTSIGNEFDSQFPDYVEVIDASANSNPLLDILQTGHDQSKMQYVSADMPQESIPFTFQVRQWRSKTSSFCNCS